MAGSNSLTDQIRDWFERTPQAQRAVKKLSEDLDIVAGHVEKATSGLLEKVGPIIDPPDRIAPPPQSATPATPAASAGSASKAESESSVPPGTKKDGEPVDPTS